MNDNIANQADLPKFLRKRKSIPDGDDLTPPEPLPQVEPVGDKISPAEAREPTLNEFEEAPELESAEVTPKSELIEDELEFGPEEEGYMEPPESAPSQRKGRGCLIAAALPTLAIAIFICAGGTKLLGITLRATEPTSTVTSTATVTSVTASATPRATVTPLPSPTPHPLDSFLGNPIERIDAAREILTFVGVDIEALNPLTGQGYYDDEGLSDTDKSLLEATRNLGFDPEGIKSGNIYLFRPFDYLTRGEAIVWKMIKEHGKAWQPPEEPCRETIFPEIACDDPLRPWILAWTDEFYHQGERPNRFDKDEPIADWQFRELLEMEEKGK